MQINKIEKIILSLILLRNILKNIPKQNQNYIDNQLDLIYDDFMRYLTYITEKYYRNGFVDGSQLVIGCLEK